LCKFSALSDRIPTLLSRMSQPAPPTYSRHAGFCVLQQDQGLGMQPSLTHECAGCA
jgi:hypothetical protein